MATAEMTTPIDFMHKLMYKLSHTYQDNPNKLNLALADLTDIAGLTQITDWTQLRDMIKADITTNLSGGGTAKDFLKNYCNIDLDNEDCGALIGYDCSGGEVLTNDNIIDEQGDLQTHPATATIRGCTVTFPAFSNSKYNYVMNGLYTWWIGLPFDLVNESYGLGFTEDSYVTSMPLDLFDEPPSGGIVMGAYVDTYYADTIAVGLELRVNMNDAAFGTIIIGDKSGNTTSGAFAALDRVLAHELTHAVMSANIRGSMMWLPQWFTEGGTAELVNGCDDSRTSDLLAAAVNIAIIDDGFSDSPTMARQYSVGFIAMRYLLKKYTDRQQKIIFPVKPKEPFEIVWEKMAHGIRSEHCVSRDGDLNKIMEEFIDFCQRDNYNLVQPWALCSNEGSKTLRISLEGHENKIEDSVCTFDSIVSFQTLLDCSNSVVLTNAIYGDVFEKQGVKNNTELCVCPFPYSEWTGSGEYSINVNNNYKNIIIANLVGGIYKTVAYNDDGFSDTLGLISDWCELSCCYAYVTNYLEAVDEIINIYEASEDTNIIVGVCRSCYLSLNHLFMLASAIYNKVGLTGQLKIVTLGNYSSIGTDLNSNVNDVISDVNSLIDLFKTHYPLLSRLVSVEHLPQLLMLKQSCLYYDKIQDFGTTCGVRGHRYTMGNLEGHATSLWINPKHVEAKFKVSSKQSTDFPCFYLSTGVFTPNTWNEQGLDYPSKVVDNNNDEYIPFNIHVLNDINMRFDLQGIGTCKKVTGKQGDADILNGIRQTGQYSYAADVISDPIPGIGCPLIVRAEKNKFKYTDIMCYFTKSSYSGTFTLIFYNENDETINPIFQSVAFGLGISEEESYKYPLYTAGGTSGLLPAWYSFSYTIPGRPPTTVTLHIYGNKFNCDMAKGDTLDSLLYPLTTDRCGISNFRLLQSDGEWQSAINYKQYFYSDEKRTIGSYVYKNDSNDTEDYLVYPTISNTHLVDRFTLVQPITVIKKHLTGENESGFMLSINGVKCKPDRLRSMMTSIDGHEYLIVPNGWFDRTLGIPLRPLQQGEYLIDVITDLVDKMPKQTYVLCIDLG